MPERVPGLDDLSCPTWDLAPATEIRRRGDALGLRRRARTAGAAIGAGALLTVPAIIMLGGGRGDDTVAGRTEPTTATERAWPASVPSGLELDRGLRPRSGPPTSGGSGDTLALVEICGRPWVTDTTPVPATDGRSATGIGADGSRERRTLLVYRDPTAAAAALADVRRSSGSCARTGTDEAVDPDSLGTDVASWGFVATPGDGDGEAALAIRVGNAILLTQSSTRGAADGADVTRLAGEAVAVLQQLCEPEDGRC